MTWWKSHLFKIISLISLTLLITQEMKARLEALLNQKTLIIYHNKTHIIIEILHAIGYLIIKSSNRVVCYLKFDKSLTRHQRN